MEKSNEEQSAVRLYLLGGLDGEARLRLEERLLADAADFEELLASEQELFEEYLSGRLPPAERERFESFFLSTPERQRDLAFARAFRRYVATHPAAATAAATTGASVAAEDPTAADSPSDATRAGKGESERPEPFWRRFFAPPSLRLRAAWALLLVVCGAAALLYFKPWQDPRADAELELARLNSASPRDADAERYFAVTLARGLTRADGETTRVRLPAGAPGALLRFERAPEPFETYRAQLKATEDARRTYTVNDLRPVESDGARVILLYVPARLLPPGDYQLRLAGRPPAGDPEELATYRFRVTAD